MPWGANSNSLCLLNIALIVKMSKRIWDQCEQTWSRKNTPGSAPAHNSLAQLRMPEEQGVSLVISRTILTGATADRILNPGSVYVFASRSRRSEENSPEKKADFDSRVESRDKLMTTRSAQQKKTNPVTSIKSSICAFPRNKRNGSMSLLRFGR